MGRLHAVALLAVIALAAGCGGPATTSQPTQIAGPTHSAHPIQTGSPTQAVPTIAPVTNAPTSQPATDGPNTPEPATDPPATAPPTFGLPTWRELAVTGGPSAREDHTWTVDGAGTTAYLFGGRGADGASADLFWTYDLATDTWAQPTIVDTPQPAARWGHTATWVPDVGLVIWSGQARSGFFDDIWAYDPATTAWTELPALGAVPAARYGSCASLGPDGELWISHGFTDSGRFSDTRSYDFETGTWTDRTPAGEVPIERCLHDCFWATTGQLVLYGGQTNGVAALGDIWAYDIANGSWSEGPESAAPPRQLYGLTSIHGGRVGVVFGGGSVDGGFLDDFWSIDPADLTMNPMLATGPSPTRRSGATLIDAGPRALLFGGRNTDGHLADLWEFGLP